jgi:two-component system LytT family sensor kinase
MKIFWKYIFPIVFGLAAYTTIRVVTDTTTGEKFWRRHWQVNAIEVVIVVLLSFVFDRILRFYINKFNSRSNAFNGKMVLKEFGQIILVFFIVLNPVVYLVHILIKSPESWSDFAIANVIVLMYVLLYYAISRGNNFMKAWIEQQLQIEKIRTDQLQTELKFLKAQYHPHFLFNALNTIYFQMDENVAEAKKSVEKFSELLRYQLYDQHQMVPVSQELHYLQNFIDLQRVRSSDRLKLDVNFDKSLNGQQVYPLLFLPLVENAFKYVGGDYQMDINATGSDKHVTFFIENSIPPVIPSKKEGGIGLENLKRRLELLYPGKHELIIKKENEKFGVSLILYTEN